MRSCRKIPPALNRGGRPKRRLRDRWSTGEHEAPLARPPIGAPDDDRGQATALPLVELQYRALTPGCFCFSSATSVGGRSLTVNTRTRDQEQAPRNREVPEVTLNFVRHNAKPLVRSHRRQTMLSPEPPPSGSGGRTATGCQAQYLPSRGTHFRKRSRLSGQGATLATACAVPDGLRSYRPVGQTLFTESPPLRIIPYGTTRYVQRRGSPFRLQLLRNTTPLPQ